MDANTRLKYNATVITAHMLAKSAINVAEKLETLIGPNQVSNEAKNEAWNVLAVCKCEE